MSDFVLTNARVLGNDDFHTGHAVLVQDGKVAAVLPESALPAGLPRHDLGGGWLLPGFIDVQVNGGGGALLNNTPDVEALRTMMRGHRRFGTTGMLPTLISDDAAVMARAVQATREAIAAGVPGILGIHLEGPYIAPARKGTHDAGKFRVPDADEVRMVTALDNGIIAHEWGHFISNRLIGNASGLTANHARGLGEGWGDFHALLMMAAAADRSMPGGWVVPALFVPPEDDETGRAIAWYVHTYGAGCLLVLAGLHVAAAAWHPWLRNDRLIACRMGFGGRSGSGTLPRAMNPSPPTGAGSVDDPPPLPPEKPLPNECCESGCPICVLDVYAEALVEYRRALAEWKRRHPDAG